MKLPCFREMRISGMKCHDRATRCFSAASSDYRGRRCWRISCRGKCGARAGQDAAEKREVPGHSEGRPALRELQAVPTTIGLQSRGWNYFPARLVHGLYEGLGARRAGHYPMRKKRQDHARSSHRGRGTRLGTYPGETIRVSTPCGL
jgi:hypothetical protein